MAEIMHRRNFDRRSFLRSLVGGVAVAAAVRTFPFRVYSFPSQVVSGGIFIHPQQNFEYLVQPIYDIYSVQVKNLNLRRGYAILKDYWEEEVPA